VERALLIALGAWFLYVSIETARHVQAWPF